jgi:divalent metal cation (Fe/Co/Zn/Cd) transporter
MSRNKKIGAAIVLVTAIVAGVGLLTGYFSIQPAVGLAVAGLLIGTGVARGKFSSTPDAARKH